MRANQAKTISISDYLSQVENIKPAQVKLGGKELWYNSPLRQGDKTPSFKVDTQLNLWFDHGIAKGGKIIDLVCELRNVTVSEALKILDQSGLYYGGTSTKTFPQKHTESLLDENHADNSKKVPAIEKEKNIAPKTYVLLSESELSYYPLLKYLQNRKIDIEIARKYLKEIIFKPANKLTQYYALGWKSGEGYEARNKYFKGFIGTGKEISHINPSKSDELFVFEGIMDFLSYLCFIKKQHNINDFSKSVVILNSTALKKQLVPVVLEHKYKNVYFFLDNDEAGKGCFDYYQETLEHISLEDKSNIYSNSKDFNEMWCDMKSQ